MRTATKVNLSREQIEAISLQHLGEKPREVVELSDGMFNTAYRLDAGCFYVLKIAPPDDVPCLRYEKDIFRAEVEVMKVVAERTSVPVPKVVAYDRTRRHVASDYYLMSFVEGPSLDKVRPSMSELAVRRAEHETGSYLRQINQIVGDSFGIYSQATHATWRGAFDWLFTSLVEDGKAVGVELPYDSLRERHEALAPLLDAVETPQLVHWDLWDGNVFVMPETGEVTGLIDFERSLWGDPLMEFNFIGPSPAFLQGYGLPSPRVGAEPRLRRLYTIYLCMVAIIEAPYRKYESVEAYQWAVDMFARELPEL